MKVSVFPKVSIIVITYGHENYIVETIKGIFDQEYDGEIELIISNDASPDKTDSVIKDFFKSVDIPRNIEIKYISQVHNLGILSNFLYVLDRVSGKYIAICEGDDYWVDPLKVHKQVNFLENNSNYCIHSGRATIIKDNEATGELGNPANKHSFELEDFFVKNNLITCTVMFRNRLIDKYKLRNVYFIDWMLYVNILFLDPGKLAYCSNDIFAHYRIHDGGAMQALDSKFKNDLTIYQHIIEVNKLVKPDYSVKDFNIISDLAMNIFKYYFLNREYKLAFWTIKSYLILSKFDYLIRKFYLKLLR